MDPFLIDRDPGEEKAARLVREFLLEADPPPLVIRQSPSGYALVVPRLEGERLLTVPGLYEADFMFHGDQGTAADQLAAFVAEAIRRSDAERLRIPLLSEEQARALAECLASQLPEWRIAPALSEVCPVVVDPLREPIDLRRAVTKAERAGLALEIAPALHSAELVPLHRARWGNNRSEFFFEMLRRLVSEGLAELVTARTAEGRLVAAQVDILGSESRHCYYMLADTEIFSGAGTAVLGIQWRRFAGLARGRYYSFGRGCERYKYRYANRRREFFDVRGFFSPRPKAR